MNKIYDFFVSGNKKEFITKWFLISIALVVITSIVSIDFFEGLELTQNIEFASYKNGKMMETGSLFVEYYWKLGRWLMPSINYTNIQILQSVGISNPFIQACFFRLTWGVFGLIAIFLLMNVSYKITNDERKSKIIVVMLSTLWFIPYFLVRGGSVTFSGVLLAIAISLLILYSKEISNNKKEFSMPLMFFIGLIFGFAVVVRLQVLPFIFGTSLWIMIYGKNLKDSIIKLSIMYLFMIIPLILGFFIDSWGYGKFTNTLLNYFDFNFIQKKANVWGTDPFWGYFYLIPNMVPKQYIILPIIIMVSYILFWIKNPKNIITWATIPFIVSHFFISHKEARFLVPIFLFIPIVLTMGLSFDKGKIYEFFKKFNLKTIAVILFVLNISGFVLVINNGSFRDTMNFQKYIYTNFKEGFEGYILDTKQTEYPFEFWMKSYFYRPKSLVINNIENIENIDKLLETKEKIYLIVKWNNLDDTGKNYTLKEVFAHKENTKLVYQLKKLFKFGVNIIIKDKYDLNLPNKNVCALYLVEKR
ncbi:MAG: hypothetical protein A2086_04405 [Spirochaetes bacterium GWD1_27_9]|nr:MAG: hypothetical protein A2Y34_00690 [Spirochaetes bacterium GWC1_27_15]OHD32328.1 MAG: hypothetical protein A2086_04405 [Spirochaetes bacterium GWD1_27_9]